MECGLASRLFRDNSNSMLTGVVTALDGSHVRYESSVFLSNEKQYYNRKGYKSLLMIASCDSTTRFNFFATGWPGCTHDSPATNDSGFYAIIHDLFPEGFFAIADSAFTLSTRLMTPVRMQRNRTDEQLRYNLNLSRARVIIERAFGLLKGRWRCLQKLHCELAYAGRYMTMCALLHNLCLEKKDICEDMMWDTLEIEEGRRGQDYDENAVHPDDLQFLPAQGHNYRDSDASQMRQHIIDELFS